MSGREFCTILELPDVQRSGLLGFKIEGLVCSV